MLRLTSVKVTAQILWLILKGVFARMLLYLTVSTCCKHHQNILLALVQTNSITLLSWKFPFQHPAGPLISRGGFTKTVCAFFSKNRAETSAWALIHAVIPPAARKSQCCAFALHPEEMGRSVCFPSHMQPSGAISWHSYVWHNATWQVYITGLWARWSVWRGFLDARFSTVTSQRS